MGDHQVFTFAKKIKGDQVTSKTLSDIRDINKLYEIVDKLEHLPRVATVPLQDLGLRRNPRKWVEKLLSDYPHILNSDMENLLFDFTDSMRTRMREDTKYVLGVLFEDKLLLCHSIYGEETVTPEWKIIPRMLDADNILRFVCFEKIQGDYQVKYWERDATSSFVEWLGLPQKQAFLFGGRYRMLSEIEGVVAEFQLTEEEVNEWLEKHPEIEKGYLNLSTPVQMLTIKEVRVAGKRYDAVVDFIQDFQAAKHGLPFYQKRYAQLKKEQLPLFVRFYDEKTQVVRWEGEDEVVELYKEQVSFDILFADDVIEMRGSYLQDVTRRCINGEPVKIVHVGEKFRMHPIKLGSIEIYNEIRKPQIIEYLAHYFEGESLRDRKIALLVKLLFLEVLVKANTESPLSFALRRIANNLRKEISLDGRFMQTEDHFVEYKSRDYFAGRDSEIVERLIEDIEHKVKETSYKLYLIGVEDNGSVKPLSASRLKSDRVESIRKRVAEALPHLSFAFFPIVADGEGILLLTVEPKR